MAEIVTSEVQAAFMEKMAQYLDALHRGDPDGMAAGFTEKGTYITGDGILYGRHEIAAYYRVMITEHRITDAKFSDLKITDKGKWIVIYMVMSNYSKDGQLSIVSPCLLQVIREENDLKIKKLAAF